jgi:uncharacterized protein (DUF1778 family)
VSGTKKTKKVGRPKLPKGHAKGHMLRMRLNEADRQLFTKAAEKSGQNLSAWIREALRKAASQ